MRNRSKNDEPWIHANEGYFCKNSQKYSQCAQYEAVLVIWTGITKEKITNESFYFTYNAYSNNIIFTPISSLEIQQESSRPSLGFVLTDIFW